MEEHVLRSDVHVSLPFGKTFWYQCDGCARTFVTESTFRSVLFLWFFVLAATVAALMVYGATAAPQTAGEKGGAGTLAGTLVLGGGAAYGIFLGSRTLLRILHRVRSPMRPDRPAAP